MLVFLFTDIEGSARLWEGHTGVMAGVIARHDVILRDLVDGHGGFPLACAQRGIGHLQSTPTQEGGK